MKRKMLFLCFTVLLGLVMVQAATADIIGTASSTGWSGTFAGASITGSDNTPVWLVQDDNLGTPNATSRIEYYPETGNASVESNVAPYNFYGDNNVQDYGNIHAGGYFRDEIYFQTYDNSPGSLQFQFHIEFGLDVNAGTASQSRFNMALLSYNGNPGGLPLILSMFDRNMIGDGSGNVTLNGVPYEDNPLWFSDTVTLDTNANGDLLASGKYIPLSFTLWTDANEGEAYWYDTVVLEGVQVYDQEGNLLDPSKYTLLSNSENFSDFNNQMPSAVPLPGAAILLGSGLLKLAIYSRRRKSASSS